MNVSITFFYKISLLILFFLMLLCLKGKAGGASPHIHRKFHGKEASYNFKVPQKDSISLYISIPDNLDFEPCNIKWFRNGNVLINEQKDSLKVKTTGNYVVTFELGCNGYQYTITDLVEFRVMTAWFPFNGNPEDVINKRTGTINGSILTSDRFGNTNSAYEFNGVSDYISFTDADEYSFPDNQFSISAWVYVNDTSGRIAVLSKRGINGPFEYSLDNYFSKSSFNFDNWVESGNGTVFGTDPLKARSDIELYTWIHIAYTCNGDTLRTFRNGILQKGFDVVKPNRYLSNTTANLEIGVGGGWDKYYYFKGKIDDIRFYNYPLNQSEINSLYSQPSGILENIFDADLIVYPNPTKERVTFSKAAGGVLIYNILGNLVKEFGPANAIATDDLPTGVYFLKIKMGNKIVSKKLIKE